MRWFWEDINTEKEAATEEQLWRALEADIKEHHSKLADEFKHRFRGDVGFAASAQVEATGASTERGFPARETKDSILTSDPVISGDFIPESSIRSIFLKGQLRLRIPQAAEWKPSLTVPRREYPFCIQIIPGRSTTHKKKYLALVHIDEKRDNYITSKYLSSLQDLLKENGTALRQLIEAGVAKIQHKKKW